MDEKLEKLMDMLQIKLAPRVYTIQYLRDFSKGKR